MAHSISSSGPSWTVNLSAAYAKFYGLDTNDLVGLSAAIGDTNGDGASDLVISAFAANNSLLDCGETYVLRGPFAPGSFDLTDADITLVGESAADLSGWSVASGGDVDGDGLDDVFVSGVLDDDGGTDAGGAFLVLGASL